MSDLKSAQPLPAGRKGKGGDRKGSKGGRGPRGPGQGMSAHAVARRRIKAELEEVKAKLAAAELKAADGDTGADSDDVGWGFCAQQSAPASTEPRFAVQAAVAVLPVLLAPLVLVLMLGAAMQSELSMLFGSIIYHINEGQQSHF